MSHIVRLLVVWLYPALFSVRGKPFFHVVRLHWLILVSLFALRELFWSCGLTVLKLGKRLSGDEPLSLKGSRCLRSSWGCRGRPGTGREARRGLPWADVPARQEGANVRCGETSGGPRPPGGAAPAVWGGQKCFNTRFFVVITQEIDYTCKFWLAKFNCCIWHQVLRNGLICVAPFS